MPGAQARIVVDEFMEGERIAKADPAFRAACARRGITDMDMVLVEPWSAGYFGLAEEEGQRLAYGHCWARSGDNPYARPLANLHPVIDLRQRKLLQIDDWGVVPLAPEPSHIESPRRRTDLKPLAIEQPEGPSFAVEGRLVRWQNWQFRVGFAIRDGLVLYDIAYQDGERLRPIMYRAALAEMVVPYGDPTGSHYRRNAFDTGEYGIGQFLDSLALGCDCLGHIQYFDAVAHDWQGRPRRIANAICLHEEDYGILWKYTDWGRGQSTVRRSRRLAISTLATLGNYVYGFFWYFYQDGTIGVEIKATGIPLVVACPPGAEPAYGRLVAPQVDAPVHQHVFCFRFDMAVDGERNAVSEVNFAAEPVGAANPLRQRRPHRRDAAEVGAGGAAHHGPRRRALLESFESGKAQPPRPAGRLQAGAGRQCASLPRPAIAGGQARRLHVPAFLGDALCPRRTLPDRLVPQPASRRRWPAALDRRRPPARGRERRRLVHPQLPPPAAARGLAGAARGLCRLPLDAGGLLRSQPGARRAAADGEGALRIEVQGRCRRNLGAVSPSADNI